LHPLLRIKERHWIAAKQEINSHENDGANSAAHGNASAAGSANIFNVLAFSSSLPEHPFRNRSAPLIRVYNLRSGQ
jgi:hypothetical protein